ncbi:MAG: hypothetical protein ACK4YF_09585 [Exilispira sp.]
MKNSTKILGIFLAIILIIILILLFIAKAYIDSKSSGFNNTFNDLPFNNLNLDNNDKFDNKNKDDFSGEFAENILFMIELDNLSNLKSFEDLFFTKADEYIRNNTDFNITDKKEKVLGSISKDFKITTKCTNAVIIFSDNEKPKISYKFYSKKQMEIKPVKFNNSRLEILSDYPDKNIRTNDRTILFAFIIIPSSYSNFTLKSGISSLQLKADSINIQNRFEFNTYASIVNLKIAKINAAEIAFDFSATKNLLQFENIISKNKISIKLNASKSEIISNLLKAKDLIIDYNASNSLINAFDLDVNSSIEIKENAGKYQYNFTNLASYPSSFTYKSNMTASIFKCVNLTNFFIKSKSNASSVQIRHDGNIDKFVSDFNFGTNKIDEKNLLNINLELNISHCEFIFE